MSLSSLSLAVCDSALRRRQSRPEDDFVKQGSRAISFSPYFFRGSSESLDKHAILCVYIPVSYQVTIALHLAAAPASK